MTALVKRSRGRPPLPADQRKPERHPSGPSSKRTASPEQDRKSTRLNSSH